MTPLKNARVLASALPHSTLVTVSGAGHMLTTECPDDVLAALSGLLKNG
jgi:pimeloyl-ACP methyl ester carboxylesterase